QRHKGHKENYYEFFVSFVSLWFSFSIINSIHKLLPKSHCHSIGIVLIYFCFIFRKFPMQQILYVANLDLLLLSTIYVMELVLECYLTSIWMRLKKYI